MPKPKIQWSYSRLALYKQCPLKYKFRVIDKLPEESSYAMERGTLIHAKAEQFVNGNITGMPKELKSFTAELKELKRRKALTELDLAITENWQPSAYNDWNNVWCRGNADAVDRSEIIKSTVVDYKTGKVREESHAEQGKLMATLEMIHNPDCKTVGVEFLYLDQNDVLQWSYKRSELPKLKKYWLAQVEPLANEKDWRPQENEYCNWCYQAKKNGGGCKIK